MDRIEIELGMWEEAPCPIYTQNVDVDKAEKMLYASMVQRYGESEVNELLNASDEMWQTRKYDRFMEQLCAEEESIIIECGGIYYEDLF